MAEQTVLLPPLISVMKVRNPEKQCVDSGFSAGKKKRVPREKMFLLINLCSLNQNYC